MLYINGRWLQGQGDAMQSHNPANGEVIWQGHAASPAQTLQAADAARTAFFHWALLSYEQRFAYLERFCQRLEAHKNDLTEHIGTETGKVAWDAASEAAATIGKLKFSMDAYHTRTGTHSTELTGVTAHLQHRPHGVLAIIGPYNFPAHLPNGQIMPALLAGNCIVFKPSELTPKVAEWMVRQWEEAGLPAGVLNLVQGAGDVGAALSQADIDGLLFTGSYATGRKLHEQWAGQPEKLLALEMGGNNPLIVGEVEDMKAATLEIIQSAFISTGQRCTCARRLIVIETSHTEALIEHLSEATRNLVIGSYSDTTLPFMGPLIHSREASRVVDAYQSLLTSGGSPLVELQPRHETLPFVSAGIVDMTQATAPADEECFGPLLQLYRVADIDAAISLANHTRYGLSAGLLCDDRATFDYALLRLRAGIINWNRQTTGASGKAPFGGIGRSGNHRPAGYYAADFCAYPTASMQVERLRLPDQLPPGITL